MEESHFWDDTLKAQNYMKELKNLKNTIDSYYQIKEKYEDVQTLIVMGYEENDESLIPEIKEALDSFIEELEELKLDTLLSEEYDRYNAILTLHAGAGGTESCDWASMLSRMYQKWADKKGYTTEILDFLDGEEAGLKSVTLQINGINAFGHLKSERGVHRLVRISPFNAAGKRQTSFVSCDVMPDIEEDVDIEIDDEDLRIDTYRSSGAGGQHVNKTSSAIRITHIPTNTVVQCQNERSQLQNKDKAMKMLKAKLYLLKKQENAEKVSDIRGEIKEIGFGNQIRSYVMQPYTLVKDHRTDAEVGNALSVLDGNLDPFINAYLKWNAQNKLNNP
ncbi:MAG: prfB [Herbinix sp.]|jgi:peptide chain release factor 2|nr:prfB [Herbinix sp.]